ncbi:MAG: Xylose transporter, periplasmic xylose-binding protein XylF [Thermoleophilia bacterium]|nr:Xylose transporter, periplasmic xylose-binding protein XylF [Thermoleophilia bacterium]
MVRHRFGRKKRNPLWFLVVAVVAALALVAAGCGGGDDEGSGTDTTAAGSCDGSIWVLLPDTASSPRWESDDRRYFEQAFTDAGVEHTVVNAEGEATTQQSQAEQAINDGAKVIVLTSLDTGSGAAIIDQAKEAGVQVIEYDRFNTGSSGGAAYVSFDNVAVGATMAEVLEPVIDGLGVDTPQVVQLNGGEEDNNAFLFKDGYAATVQKHVDDGSWALVADNLVPGWGANGEGQTIMEQVLTDAGNKVDAVFAANDNLAQQAINALEGAGIGPVPLSGQDASATGIQNILLGNQTMTVYKPIQAEADIAAKAALALCAGEDPSTVTSDFEYATIGINAADGKPAEAGTGVPYLALTPTGVTVDNIADTVIADGFRTVEEVCTGDTAETDFCKENS